LGVISELEQLSVLAAMRATGGARAEPQV
jgi:hypothetical protein